MSTQRATNKFVRFLQNNMVLLIVIMSIIAVASIVLIVSLSPNDPVEPNKPVIKDPVDDPDDPTNKDPDPDKPDPLPPTVVKTYYASPLNYSGVGMEYSDGQDTIFVFNQTLNQWKTHRAVDLLATEGTAVVSMFDGTVLTVSESYGLGNTVTVDHGQGVIATYASLGQVDVVDGQTVKKGDNLGTVSTTANYEFMDGAHLHLSVEVNGEIVDPMPYVLGEVFTETSAPQ